MRTNFISKLLIIDSVNHLSNGRETWGCLHHSKASINKYKLQTQRKAKRKRVSFKDSINKKTPEEVNTLPKDKQRKYRLRLATKKKKLFHEQDESSANDVSISTNPTKDDAISMSRFSNDTTVIGKDGAISVSDSLGQKLHQI